MSTVFHQHLLDEALADNTLSTWNPVLSGPGPEASSSSLQSKDGDDMLSLLQLADCDMEELEVQFGDKELSTTITPCKRLFSIDNTMSVTALSFTTINQLKNPSIAANPHTVPEVISISSMVTDGLDPTTITTSTVAPNNDMGSEIQLSSLKRGAKIDKNDGPVSKRAKT